MQLESSVGAQLAFGYECSDLKTMQRSTYGRVWEACNVMRGKIFVVVKKGSDLIRVLNPLASGRDSPKTILGKNHPKIICWVSPQSNQNRFFIHLAKIVLSSISP